MFNRYKYKACQCPCHSVHKHAIFYGYLCVCDCKSTPAQDVYEENEKLKAENEYYKKHNDILLNANTEFYNEIKQLKAQLQQSKQPIKCKTCDSKGVVYLAELGKTELRDCPDCSEYSPDAGKMAEPEQCEVSGVKLGKRKCPACDRETRQMYYCQVCHGAGVVWEPK